MSDNIVNIVDHMEHVVLTCKKSVHVCPVLMFKDVVSGKLKFSEIERGDEIAVAIIEEWLSDRGIK